MISSCPSWPGFQNPRPQKADLNLFKAQTRFTDRVSYKQDSFGGGFGFGVPLTEFMSYSLGYQYNRSKLTDIPAGSSLALLSQEGVQTTSEVSNALLWDTRNRTIAATEGHIERLGVNVAGLGGDNKFYEISASSKSYFSLNDDFVLNPAFSFKSINALGGKDIPIYRRYSMGG